MLVDLVLSGKDALVVGSGLEPEFKTKKLLDAEARVTVLGESFTKQLSRLASRDPGRIRLVRAKPTPASVANAIEETSPRVVFISTGDSVLDETLSDAARAAGSKTPLVCVVDDPRLNDFNMPAIAKAGDISVGVSTGGRSPAMAGILRRKIEKMITEEDVLQVRLQGYIRKASKSRLKDAASRKEFAYKVIRDKQVGALLKKGDYAGAKRLAERMLREEASGLHEKPRARRGASRND